MQVPSRRQESFNRTIKAPWSKSSAPVERNSTLTASLRRKVREKNMKYFSFRRSKMKKVMVVALIAVMGMAVGGCGNFPGNLFSSRNNQAKADRGAGYLRDASLVDEGGGSGRDAVQNARQWAKKYATLADKCIKLQLENKVANDQNRKLDGQVAKLKGELAQAKKEVSEANSMLDDLNKELAKWKRDVLGFREEMRLAQQAQMKMMSRIIMLMGGTVPEEGSGAGKKLVAKGKE